MAAIDMRKQLPDSCPYIVNTLAAYGRKPVLRPCKDHKPGISGALLGMQGIRRVEMPFLKGSWKSLRKTMRTQTVGDRRDGTLSDISHTSVPLR